MKKILPLLGGLVITSIASTSVVSCIAPRYAVGSPGQRVVVSTSGRINDHSFNQDAYIGMKNFVKSEYGLDGQNNYVEAADTSSTSVVSAYRLAKLKRADAVILPGFNHITTIAAAAKLFGEKTIVLVDGTPGSTDKLYDHVISVLFNSQLGGVQAAFDAAYWATTKVRDAQGNETEKMQGDASGDGKITFGTFAGASNKYGVDNYMWGLLLGMDLFNKWYGETRGYVRLANTDDYKIESVKVTNTSSYDWWTNNFDLGGATKSGIVSKLVDDRKADIIFPVAGPQIEDVLNYHPRSSSYKGLPYVIGIDVDQAEIFNGSAYHGRFITSAIKNVHSATKIALQHAQSLVNKKVDGSYAAKTSADEVWDGTTPGRYKNWSVDLLDDGSGKYKISKHYLRLFDGENGDNPDEAGSLPVDASDVLINFVNNAFADLGTTAIDYLNGKIITKLAQEIIDKARNEEFRLIYDEK
ncbi:hypothetical protein LD119_00617 [Mesoplasma sp. JKS002660]|uniref:hypothetical protein n=1 Tax=Mesoplasma whartonense TaxID=2878854 RepID=UPI0020229C13|nr:hypothetical protein [Mesoplasma sp. JKS002660]MCL8213684.1 hypothetical protein [Mesoplasma sp. JKS002660]